MKTTSGGFYCVHYLRSNSNTKIEANRTQYTQGSSIWVFLLAFNNSKSIWISKQKKMRF